MNFDLPYTLEVDGIERAINCDFRDVLNIFKAFNDNELSSEEKQFIALNNLYVDDFTIFKDINEAINRAYWFFDWGKDFSQKKNSPRLMDWEKDYSIIISAANKSAKTVEDIRELPFLHWWTFLGYFAERGECQFSTIMNIREKLSKGKKLDKWEQEILSENQEIILNNDSDETFEAELWGGDM